MFDGKYKEFRSDNSDKEFKPKREERPARPRRQGEKVEYGRKERKLTEDYGIPPSEVRFIQECKTDKARKAVICCASSQI